MKILVFQDSFILFLDNIEVVLNLKQVKCLIDALEQSIDYQAQENIKVKKLKEKLLSFDGQPVH